MSLSSDDIENAQILWDYMNIARKPARADVIIGLGCHDMGVADDAASLYLSNIAPLIVFSGSSGRTTEGLFDRSEAELFAERAMALGVPENAILCETASTNTGQNIRYSQKLLNKHGLSPRSVLLVHKPYMLRRDYATFMKQWEQADQIDIGCWASATSLNEYLASSSLSASETIAIMVGDVQRLTSYARLEFQIEQTIPQQVSRAMQSLIAEGYDKHLTLE